MLPFKKLNLEDAPTLLPYFRKRTVNISDQTFGSVMMWRNVLQTEYCEKEGSLYFRNQLKEGVYSYSLPLGDPDSCLKELQAHCKERGEPLIFTGVSSVEEEWLRTHLPLASSKEVRDWFDYLYPVEQMIHFAGKKLAGQRNHRNAFLKQFPQWEFAAVNSGSLPELKAFMARYREENEKDSFYFRKEMEAVFEVLDHYEVYDFLGGMIRVNGEIVAASFGEIVGDTMYVHIEKALRSFRGAYPMITSQFLHYYFQDGLLFVNREEDMGDEGLRYSKSAYHPCCLLKKYIIEEKR
jgi:hypothetical protein